MWKKQLAIWKQHPYVERLRKTLLAIKLPLFENVPLYFIIKFYLKELLLSDIPNRASALSFNFFLALFPATIFLFSLIPYIPIPNLDVHIFFFFKDILPENAFLAIESTIIDIATNQQGNLLSIGAALALFFSSNGVHALIESFNKDYPIFFQRSFLKKRLLALGLTLVESLILLIASALLIGGEWLIDYMKETGFLMPGFWTFILQASRILLTAFLIFLAIALLFYFGPSTHQRWRFFSAGASLATTLFILFSEAFSWYVSHFGQYNKLYGSLGTLIVFMLWLYFNAISILIGFELNTSIYTQKDLFNKD
jgi:membrane protein